MAAALPILFVVLACGEAEPATALRPTPAAVAAPEATQAVPQQTPTPSPLPAVEVPTTASPATPPVSGPAPEVLYERGGELWSLAAASYETRLVARGQQGSNSFALGDPWALAPDGRHLAMARNVEGQAVLTLILLPGGQPQDVARAAGRVDALYWSHDATRVAYVVNQRDERTGDLLNGSLRVYDVAGRREATLFEQSFKSSDAGRQELWLEGWVPGNGALYVAVAMDRTADPGVLCALSAAGGEPRVISSGFLLKGGQAVSPATWRVLLRGSAGGRSSPVYVAQAAPDGSLSDIRLLSPEDWIVGAVAWRPDGQAIVAERLEAQPHGSYAGHLWLLEPDGAAPRPLTADPAYREEQPVWTLDGQQIVFARRQATRQQPAGLWALRLPDELTLLDQAGGRPQAAGGAR